MPAEDALRQHTTIFREVDALVRILLNVAFHPQPGQGFSYGGPGHAEFLGETSADDRLAFHGHVVDSLEIFFGNRRRHVRNLAARCAHAGTGSRSTEWKLG